MPEPLTPLDLQAFLDEHAIPAEIVHLDALTPTVETAAAAVGCQPEQIVKSILFLVQGQPHLAVTCGTQRVDSRALAAHSGVGRKQVKLADAETVLALAGYPVGAMPPFGHRQPLPTLMDPSVLAQAEVYAGGGSDSTLLRIQPELIRRHAAAEVLALHAA
ncbi:MAG: YbaK/EbsC family protein [Chloroflexi bacterium]|nr:YbaK/EbsC family protein [Chloroflexota bacterium]